LLWLPQLLRVALQLPWLLVLLRLPRLQECFAGCLGKLLLRQAAR
jgi:hypothetical protein